MNKLALDAPAVPDERLENLARSIGLRVTTTGTIYRGYGIKDRGDDGCDIEKDGEIVNTMPDTTAAMRWIDQQRDERAA